MKPNFKQVGISKGEIDLNNRELFWVPFEASHISFKKGKVSYWLLEREDSSWDEEEKNYNNHRSSRNRTFIRKEGNCFSLSEFKLSSGGSGYHYGQIEWDWRCRKCLKSVSRVEIMNSKEECSQCQKESLKNRLIPL